MLGVNNKSRLIRKLLRDYIGLGPDLIDKELKEFREAVKQLTGIARNLNQITARINKDNALKTPLTDEYLKRIKEQVIEVNNRLKSYVNNTISQYQEIVNHEQ